MLNKMVNPSVKNSDFANTIYSSILSEMQKNDAYKANMPLKRLDIISNLKLPISENMYMKLLSDMDPDKYTKDGEFINYDKYGEYQHSYKLGDYYANHAIYSDYLNIKTLKYIKDKSNKKLKICDLGCGYGTFLYVCKKMGYDVTGVEYQKKMKKFNKMLGIEDVIYGDFFNINMSFLSDFDVIYLYRPIDNPNKMKDLINIVHKNMRSDAIVVYTYPYSDEINGFKILGEKCAVENLILNIYI